MDTFEGILLRIKQHPGNVRFKDLCKVCDHYFGSPHQKGSSHRIYKTPWPGNPRINVQNHKGWAKTYQVKQVLKAIEILESDYAERE
jgi:hypothetical protein